MGLFDDFSRAISPHAAKLNDTISLNGAALHQRLQSIENRIADRGRPDVGDLFRDLEFKGALTALTPIEFENVPMNEQWAIQSVSAIGAAAAGSAFPEGTQTVANPAAGKDWSFTVVTPMRVSQIFATLKTSAQVANRIPSFRIVNAAGRTVWSTTFAEQAASLTRSYTATPPNLLLLPGYKVESVTTAIQTEDQWEAITLSAEAAGGKRIIVRANGKLRLVYPLSETLPQTSTPGGDVVFLPGEHLTLEAEASGEVEVSVQVTRTRLTRGGISRQTGRSQGEVVAPMNTHDPARDVIQQRLGHTYQEVPPEVRNTGGKPPLVNDVDPTST